MSRKLGMIGVLRYLERKTALLLFFLFVTPVSAGVLLLGSIQLRAFTDLIATGGRGGFFQALGGALWFLGALLIRATLHFGLANYVSKHFALMMRNLRAEMFRLFASSRPMSVAPRDVDGALTTRASELERSFQKGAAPLLIDVGDLLGLIAVAIWLDWVAGGVMVASALLIVVLVEVTLGRKRVNAQDEILKARSGWDRTTRAYARPAGQRALRLMVLDYVVERVSTFNERRRGWIHKEGRYTAFASAYVNFGSGVTVVATLSTVYLHKSVVSPGSLILISGLTVLFQGTLMRTSQSLQNFRLGYVALPVIGQVLALGRRAPEHQEVAPEFAPLTVEGVIVRDEDENTLLQVPEMGIEPGNTILVQGRGRVGKTLLVFLLSGLLHPKPPKGGLSWTGDVLLGGISSDKLFKQIALIEGIIPFFLSLGDERLNDSIESFLKAVRPNATLQEMEEALQAVGLLEVVQAKGIATPLSRNPLDSEGLRLLAVARLVLLPPVHRRLIIIDGLFDKLNAENRERVAGVLQRMEDEGATIVVTASEKTLVPSTLTVDQWYKIDPQTHEVVAIRKAPS